MGLCYNDRMLKSDLLYIKDIPGVEKNKIGHLINQGIHHRVYCYDGNKVIKIPRKQFNFLYSTKSHLELDLSLLKKYFPELAIQTQVLASDDHTKHCMIQEYIDDFELITRDNIELIKPDLNKLFIENKKLFNEWGMSLDIIGGEGFFSCIYFMLSKTNQAYFSNLVIVKKGEHMTLKLIDIELLRLNLPSYSLTDFVSYISSNISLLITNLLLIKVFGLKWSLSYKNP